MNEQAGSGNSAHKGSSGSQGGAEFSRAAAGTGISWSG
jgi:hypothetical protein